MTHISPQLFQQKPGVEKGSSRKDLIEGSFIQWSESSGHIWETNKVLENVIRVETTIWTGRDRETKVKGGHWIPKIL